MHHASKKIPNEMCIFSQREIKKENRKNGSVEMNPSECCLVEIEFISTSFVCLFVCLIGG